MPFSVSTNLLTDLSHLLEVTIIGKNFHYLPDGHEMAFLVVQDIQLK